MSELNEILPRTAARVHEGIERGLHLGAQISVSRGGVSITDTAVGLASLAHDEAGYADAPLTPDHLMLWMSACKPVGAVAAAQLWEQGRLDLDAPVSEYVPEFAQGGKEGITTRHILVHTCGFRNADVDHPEMAWDDIIQRICASELERGWIVGETAGYHLRSSWYMLAEIIGRIDGRHFSQYVREAIFKPLNMHHSSIGTTREEWEHYGDRIAPAYLTVKGMPEPMPWHTAPWCVMCRPGGNGRGPIRELGWFYEALVNGGERNGARILKEETVHEFTRPHRVGKFDETMRHKMDWSLGFIIDSKRYGIGTMPYSYGRHCSPATFGHGGFQATSGFADPEHGLVVAVAFNGLPGEAKHNKRIRDVASAVYEDLELAEPGL